MESALKKFLPYLVGGLGLLFIGIAVVLRSGTADAETAITNVASTFMLIAGAICFLAGIVTFFLRHDETVW